MGKKSPSAPAAPDPTTTARAQAAANKEAVTESARVNQINQVTPYGSVNFTGEIGSPERTQTLTLNPESQDIFETQQGISKGLTDFASEYVPRVSQGLSTPFNTADIVPQAPSASPEERLRIEQGLMDRLNPYIDRDQDRLNTQLANQGVNLGSRAYGSAQDDFGRTKNDARLAVIGQAGGEQARQFGLQQTEYQQALADALLNRTQGLNEVSALLQGAPSIQTPNAPPVSQYNVAPPDIMGANQLNYAAQQNAYNQQLGRQNAGMGGLFSLGAAGIGLL